MHSSDYVRVWDPLIRLFHWMLVVGFAVAYVTEDEWRTLHVQAGYLILLLLVFRLIWGVAGTRYARFSSFFCRPSTVLDHLHDLFLGQARRYLGHDPAGAAMAITLMLFLLLTGVTGLLAYGTEQHAGPMAGWIKHASHVWGDIFEEAHEVLANLTLFLIGVHLAGVVVGSIAHGENLVLAMLTGRKRAPEG